MSLQRNSALSLRTICLSKPVSELVLQTGLTRPRLWTEEVSDLGRGLFFFEFPAQITPTPPVNIPPTGNIDRVGWDYPPN
jgi:hypothetical protein